MIPNYSDVLRGPKDFRKIMQEARNEDKVEEREQEKRSNNFIIHGLKEGDETNDELKKNDEEIIGRFLEKVGVPIKQDSESQMKTKNEH